MKRGKQSKHRKLWSKLPRRIRSAVQRYADAQEAHSWMGAGDPEDFPAIERELKDAKEHLARVLLTVAAIRR